MELRIELFSGLLADGCRPSGPPVIVAVNRPVSAERALLTEGDSGDSPSSPASSWVGLLSNILDDDHRTRRAERLLSHVTVWLMILGAMVVTATLLLLSAPRWALAVTSGTGVASAGVAWLRRRQRTQRAATDDSRSVVPHAP